MKNIGIIDADLISRKKHRFPNLACMKLSGYNKKIGNSTNLILKWDEDLTKYNKIYISKVFTDTIIPEEILNKSNVEYGGTGFYYDKAPFLPAEIEHSFPDYDLYKEWVDKKLESGTKKIELQYYTDWSIGYTTRFCFRQCGFCVNKNYKKVDVWSPLEEFVDNNRKNICLLDDNMLGSSEWKTILESLQSTKKPFQYKQGLDERLLTKEKIEMLFLNSKYKGDYTFAFDNIEDKKIIEEKLKLIRDSYRNKGQNIKFYVFCGFDRNDRWDLDFWKQDIIDTFERIKILMRYNCLPYIMRFNRYEESPHRGTYINLARWCNQPSFFKKMSYRDYCEANQARTKTITCSAMRYLNELEEEYPEIAKKYFDIKFEEIVKY
jgi:hypothetical protein